MSIYMHDAWQFSNGAGRVFGKIGTRCELRWSLWDYLVGKFAVGWADSVFGIIFVAK